MRTWMLLLPLLAACNTAKILDRSTLRRVLPGMMPVEDVAMVCTSGTALAPLVPALTGDRSADRALVLTGLSAGMCADLGVWEAELERLRAPHEGRGAAAVDLLERETRLRALAASRYLSAWDHLEAAYGEVGGEAGCPKLSEKDGEPLLYLLGLSSGLLAMIHDQAAQGAAGAPLDIPPRVMRAAGCLDSDALWQVPLALQLAIQASLPGHEREAALPALAAASAKGEAEGLWLGRAFQIQTLASLGEDAALREAIAAHAEARAPSNGVGDPQWGLLNSFATRLIQHESDRLWMREVGQRTPLGRLGTFPAADAFDFGDDLLEGLLPPLVPSEEETP